MSLLMTPKEKEDATFVSNKELIWPVKNIYLTYDFFFYKT
jgi:hypothetical protein